MIYDSPSHLYCSALKFPPSSSWLHQYYSAGLSQEVKVIRGFSSGWGTCFRTVLLDSWPEVLTYWKDTIAVGLRSNDIITLNAVTGRRIAVLSGHTDEVLSLTFSPDGTSLVSGSEDKTIKLWDMQTGGVVKTFQGHTGEVLSVSISVNCTTIASWSEDQTICLWDIQTGECHCIIQQESDEGSVCFFPLDPQHFISISDGKVQEWNIDGHKIAPEYGGSYAAFSFDGTKLVLCNGAVVQVQSTDY
jgi:WD40 repeat protein